MATETSTTPENITSFEEMLRELERGQLGTHLSGELRQMVTALLGAKESGVSDPKGAITLTVHFQLQDEGILTILGNVRAKHPQMPRQKSVFFPAEDGALSRRHPQQKDLFDDRQPKAGPQLHKAG